MPFQYLPVWVPGSTDFAAVRSDPMGEDMFDESFGLDVAVDDTQWNRCLQADADPEHLAAGAGDWSDTWLPRLDDEDDDDNNTGWKAMELSNVPPYSFGGLQDHAYASPQPIFVVPSAISTEKLPNDTRDSSTGTTCLTASEVRRLGTNTVPSLPSSRTSSSESQFSLYNTSPSQSPMPQPKGRARKHKSLNAITEDQERVQDAEDESSCRPFSSRKREHNAIEQRYRFKLNDKIATLGASVPFMSRKLSINDDDDLDFQKSTCRAGRQQNGKAAILTRALEYIRYLECSIQGLGAESDALRARVTAFEKLALNRSGIAVGSTVDELKPALAGETLEQIKTGFLARQAQPVAASAKPTTMRRRTMQN